MYEYEEFLNDHLGKRINCITYVEYKKDVQETKRYRKKVRKITHLVLLRCDCGNESWNNVFSLMKMKNDKISCDNCIMKRNQREKDLVKRLKSQTVFEDMKLSKGEYINRYFSYDE